MVGFAPKGSPPNEILHQAVLVKWARGREAEGERGRAMKFELYHLATENEAEQIVETGVFPDQEQDEAVSSPGVWLSDRALIDPEGQRTVILKVDVYMEGDELSGFEVVSNPPKIYREWRVPAAVLNDNAVVTPPERKPAPRPPSLTDDDEFNLRVYLMGSMIVKRLTSDEASERESAAATLKESGLDPDEAVRLHHQDHKEAVRFVLRGIAGADVPDETLATCAQLVEDDAIFDYVVEQMSEDAVRESGLMINGIAIGGTKDDRKGGGD
jgi:hypothetical protein